MTEKILNATSKCPYNECDGYGISVIRLKDGSRKARPCKCYDDLIIKRRIKAANMPPEFENIKVNDFLTDIYSGKNKSLAINAKKIVIGYITKFKSIKETGKGLFFYSEKKGSGKTRLAVGVGNALIKNCNQTVRFLTTIALLNKIKASFDSEESTEGLIYEMSNVDVLILDDIGSEKPTEWVNNILFTIINDRMSAKKITIFTSNTAVELLNLDERITSRIGKMTIPIKMPEQSIRDKQSRAENEAILKLIME